MKKENSSSKWSLLATFSWLQEAILLKARLEGAGISAQIPEEHIASISPPTTAMQVRVLVRTIDLEQAREVLNIVPDVSEDASACAKCGSTRLRRKSSPLKNFFLILSSLLFSAPVRKAEKTVCADCGALSEA